MSYYRGGNRRPAPRVIGADDIGSHVTLVVRKPAGGNLYVSGMVRDVTTSSVTLGVMHHPTGPWDKFEAYEAATTIEHRRIVRRA